MEIFGGSIDSATVHQALQSGGSVEAAAATLSELLLLPPAAAATLNDGKFVLLAGCLRINL